MPLFYFAYGSNMNEERMLERGVEFTQKEKAILKGYQLAFNKIAGGKVGTGYANIIPCDGSVVEGILYAINEEGIKQLDIYEGVSTENYYRTILKIETGGGKMVEAEVYIAHDHRIDDTLQPEREYLNHLLKGRDLLSEGYYRFLLDTKTID